MFFLGLLSVSQLTLLPGLTVVRWFKPKGTLQYFLFAFALSPLLNFFLVWFLCLFKLLYQSVAFSVIATEVLILALLVVRRSRIEASFNLPVVSRAQWALLVSGVLLIGISLAMIAGHAFIGFHHNDAILSFNVWAHEWVDNLIPMRSHRYPQLIPANWALSYIITGDIELQLFAHAMMPAFVIGLGFSFLSLANSGLGFVRCFIAAVALLSYVALDSRNELRTFWFETADVPAAFYGWLSTATIFLATLEDRRAKFAMKLFDDRLLIFGAILAAAAALSKQAGLWLFFGFPILTMLLRELPLLERIKRAAFSALLTALIAVPWYLFKEVQIIRGIDISEFHMVTQTVFKGLPYLQRFRPAWELFSGIAGGAIPMMLLLSLVLWSFKRKDSRIIALFIFIPYYLLWAFLFSYDRRNLAFAMPGFCFCAATGISLFLRGWISEPLFRSVTFHIPRSVFCMVPVIFFASSVGLDKLESRSDLVKRQEFIHKRLGVEAVNRRLYEYFQDHMLGGILTNYHMLFFVPGFKGEYISVEDQSLEAGLSLDIVRYVLVHRDYIARHADIFKENEQSGFLKLIWEEQDYLFFVKTGGSK